MTPVLAPFLIGGVLRHVLVLLLLVTSALQGWAEVSDVTLTIGDGWGVVRELRPVDLVEGEQDFFFDNIPPEADLSSLVLRCRRIPVEVVSWSWADEGEGPARTGDDSLVVMPDGSSVKWYPRSGAGQPVGSAERQEVAAPGKPRRLHCRIRAPLTGRRPVELIYRIENVRWSVRYQALVRGELQEEHEQLAVDFEGRVHIENRTARSFSNVLVRLVGRARAESAEGPEPGILMLHEDHPLSATWIHASPDPEPEYLYRVPQRVNVAAARSVDVPLVSARRAPASALYVMTSENVPLTTKGQGYPLAKKIVLKNTSSVGLGWGLPPGPVEVFLGGMRGHLLSGARIPYTPIDGEIRIDLGTTPDVLGGRRKIGQKEAADGSSESDYEITVENRSVGPVRVEISEKPVPLTGWNVLSSTEHFTERGNRLLFEPTARKGETRIQYTLRIVRPTL